MANKLRFIPLGGLGEIGRNMTLFEYGKNILIVDAGVMFPEADMLGIDLVIPNFEYLRDKKDWVRGIVITHGHEDHTGALPYLLEEINAPIYSTRLVLALVERKLKEYFGRRYQAQLHEINAGDAVRVGPFTVHPVPLSHSIPDSMALAIDTPVGRIMHSGDFKIDFTPTAGDAPNLIGIASLATDGVLALFSDSTGAERAGFTPSEKTIEPAFDKIMREAPGRVIVASFASQLSRLQLILDISQRYNRKVAIAGRSMAQNFDTARKLGYLKVPKGVHVRLETANKLPPNQVTMMVTGSQGQPEAALARMAAGQHRDITLRESDTVVISSTPIPGNEEEVARMINQLVDRVHEVVYPPLAHVHVSGHASQEEMKLLLSLVRPHFFVPVHGERRHLHFHARLAEGMGIARDHIFEVQNGDILEISPEGCKVVDKTAGGYVFVDGAGVGDIGPKVLRERDVLAKGGFVTVFIPVHKRSRKLVGSPRIVSRGVVYSEQADEVLKGAEDALQAALKRSKRTKSALENNARDALSRYFYKATRRRPMVVPVVIEIDN
ncbi:MAG: ribonuclease J [Chloroflexi bacterium]|nr:ribonuclease J [Chloroflexota bacterium]